MLDLPRTLSETSQHQGGKGRGSKAQGHPQIHIKSEAGLGYMEPYLKKREWGGEIKEREKEKEEKEKEKN